MLLAQNKSMILLFYDISFPLLPAEGALGGKKKSKSKSCAAHFLTSPCLFHKKKHKI